MSYNKNLQRAKEGQEGKSQTVSTQLSLNHGVPHNVMKGEYGTDDIDYLLGLSPKKGYLPIKKDGEEFHINRISESRKRIGQRSRLKKWKME